MERDLLARIDATRRVVKSRKHEAGFTSAVAAIALLGLVAVMGSVALIWGNNFNVEKQKLGDYYTTNVNKIKERIIIEDVWLSTNPDNIGIVSIRNVGDIGIKVSEVRINVLDSTGGAACTTTCDPGTSASNNVRAPFNPDSTNGLINSQQSLVVAVDKIDWNHANSKTLEVFITTERGSMVWRVYDWKTQLAQVYTCNSLPATIIGTSGNDDIPGTTGDDVIVSLSGNDGILPSAGNDTICGGDGDDLIEGGDGNDVIFGEGGDDRLYGENNGTPIGTGDDFLDGGPHVSLGDTCVGGPGTNTIINCSP